MSWLQTYSLETTLLFRLAIEFAEFDVLKLLLRTLADEERRFSCCLRCVLS